MQKTLMAVILMLAAGTSTAMAGHANPWATSEDTLLMQYHEENLAQSVDTPGEDEMLGVMVRSARGKLDGLSGGGKGGEARGGGQGRR